MRDAFCLLALFRDAGSGQVQPLCLPILGEQHRGIELRDWHLDWEWRSFFSSEREQMRDTVWEQITTEGSVLLVASPDPLACANLHNHRPRPLARVAPPAMGSRMACMLATPAACSYAPRAARAPVCARCPRSSQLIARHPPPAPRRGPRCCVSPTSSPR
jgi:hypothetical protein